MVLVWQAVKEKGERLTQEEFIQFALDACEDIFAILNAATL